MADIKTHLNNIKGALYGKDVRSSIHDGMDAINKETENTTSRQVDLENTFDQLVINAGNSNAEIVDARVKNDGTSYSKLGDRLNEVDLQLEHNANLLEKKIYYFDNIENMKKATFLKNGDMAITLGYFKVNDGGNAKYIITESRELEDLGSVISLNNDLKAELIIGNGVDCRLFGCGNETLAKEDLIKRFDNWVNYVNNTKGKYFAPTGGDTVFFIYKPLLLKKSIIGINKPVFMYISTEVGRVISDTEKSYSGNYDFCVKGVIGIKQISENEGERLKIKGIIVNCTNGDDDTIPSQDYGLYIPEINNFEMSDIMIIRPNKAGIKIFVGWMGDIKSINVWMSRYNGYELEGTFTSLNVSNCYAHGYKKSGWSINGAVYCNFNSLASDTDSHANSSYTIASCWGTNFNGLGSEGGIRDFVIYIGDFTGSITGLFVDGVTIASAIVENFASSNFKLDGFRYRNLKVLEDRNVNSFKITNQSSIQKIELNIENDEISINSYIMKIQTNDNLGTLIVNKPINSYSIKQNVLRYINESQTVIDLGYQAKELTVEQIQTLTKSTIYKPSYYRYSLGVHVINGMVMQDTNEILCCEYRFNFNSNNVINVRRWDNSIKSYTEWKEVSTI